MAPIPTTTHAFAPLRRSTSTPATFLPSSITSLGHFSSHSSPHVSAIASATASPAAIVIDSCGGAPAESSSTVLSRTLAPGRLSHGRPCRPRPQRWHSAVTTRPSVPPCGIAASATSLVESTSGKHRMLRPIRRVERPRSSKCESIAIGRVNRSPWAGDRSTCWPRRVNSTTADSTCAHETPATDASSSRGKNASARS